MNHQSLDKITVTDIVEMSGKTRQTFYRYFRDKYDLVNWYFEVLADKSFYQIGNSEEIQLIGVCTDICVISNAIILKSAFPEVPIKVIEKCCAGVSPESHQTALKAMKACQIIVKD